MSILREREPDRSHMTLRDLVSEVKPYHFHCIPPQLQRFPQVQSRECALSMGKCQHRIAENKNETRDMNMADYIFQRTSVYMPQHSNNANTRPPLHLRYQTFLILPCTFFSKCSGALQRKYEHIGSPFHSCPNSGPGGAGDAKMANWECLSQQVEDSLGLWVTWEQGHTQLSSPPLVSVCHFCLFHSCFSLFICQTCLVNVIGTKSSWERRHYPYSIKSPLSFIYAKVCGIIRNFKLNSLTPSGPFDRK